MDKPTPEEVQKNFNERMAKRKRNALKTEWAYIKQHKLEKANVKRMRQKMLWNDWRDDQHKFDLL